MKNLKMITAACVALCACAAVSAATVEVKPGGGVSYAQNKAMAQDTIILKRGVHTLSGRISSDKDFVIMGEGDGETTVDFTNVTIGGGGGSFVFDNLNLVTQRPYLVYIGEESEVDVELIAFKNCTIDMSGASTILLNRSQQQQNTIGKFLIDNCVIFSANADSHGLVNVTKESTAEISQIEVKNSTIADFKRGVILVNNASRDLDVLVENVTLYNVNHSENPGAIFHFTAGKADVKIKNSIYHIPGRSPKFIEVSSRGRAMVYSSYRTYEQAKLRDQYQTTTLAAPAQRVFASPANDPTAEGVSFKIVDKKISGANGEKQIGDPRWNK